MARDARKAPRFTIADTLTAAQVHAMRCDTHAVETRDLAPGDVFFSHGYAFVVLGAPHVTTHAGGDTFAAAGVALRPSDLPCWAHEFPAQSRTGHPQTVVRRERVREVCGW